MTATENTVLTNRRIRIGLVVDFIISEYSEFLIEGVMACAKKMNLDIIVIQAGELNNPNQNYDYQNISLNAHITKQNLDGVIFVSGTQTHYVELKSFVKYIKSFNLPIVNIAAVAEGVPSIIVDYREAFRLLVEHVVRDVGAKRIAVMAVESQSKEVVERTEILKQVFSEYSVSENSITWFKATFSYSSATFELTKYAEEHPEEKFDYDAFFALNDDMAMACIDFLRDKGRMVPEQCVVTGFDDMRKAVFNKPALSTVNQRVFEQGYVAARTLYDMIEGNEVPWIQEIQGKAVLRQSTNADLYINRIKNNERIGIDRAALAGAYTDVSADEWYHKRTQLYRIQKCYLDMEGDMPLERAIGHVGYNLRSFGIPYLAAVTFEKPITKSEPFESFELPEKARIRFGYDVNNPELENYSKQEIYFNPREGLLPVDLLNFSGNAMMIFSLYNGEKNYGYMIVQKTNFDVAMYEILAKIISSLCAKEYK